MTTQKLRNRLLFLRIDFLSFIFLFLFFITIVSCKNNLRKKIICLWSISSIISNDSEVTNYYTNSLVFHEDESCFLPQLYSEIEKKQMSEGKWKFEEISDSCYIIISSINKTFNRKFYIKSYNVKNEPEKGGILIELWLVSKDIELKCHTNGLCYDEN